MARRDIWKHREGHPGYFVTEDGKKQMLMSPKGSSFAICETVEKNGGYRVIRGPAREPAKLGIPQKLLDEAEEMTVADVIGRLKSGQQVTIDVTAMAGLASRS